MMMEDPKIRNLLDVLGHTSLYPSQEQAISHGLLEGKNLLVTSPTASGKTLIAIMAAIKAFEKADILVLTNEKMDSLIRHGTSWISDVGLFVVDEVHLIGERERGPTLEMILTIIRKVHSNAQILALSATVSNSADIAEWLDCHLIETN